MSEVVKARQCFQEREWIEIFKARKACGKTVTQFCKDENITESKYYYWLKKIRVQALTCVWQVGIQPARQRKSNHFGSEIQPPYCSAIALSNVANGNSAHHA